MSVPGSAEPGAAHAPDLLVMIPGAGMKPADLVAAGFLADVASRGLALEVRVLDCDAIGAALQGAAPAAAVAELRRARREGRRRAWLGGISLGGLLALALALDEPGSLDGLCLIAPYPGSRPTLAAIERAGGLAAWRPTADQLGDPEFRVWNWLRRPPAALPVFVGWGSRDRFAQSIALLAGCFAPSARCAVDGGHEWATWRALWQRFLDCGHFAPQRRTGHPIAARGA